MQALHERPLIVINNKVIKIFFKATLSIDKDVCVQEQGVKKSESLC